jgi:3-hydroxymyristoyl/3-hydroxydecanoyl-(acyl carrier protein) dehydratase
MQIKSSGCISADHPALAGHFPGQPIVPGVLLLREVLAAIEHQWHLAAGPVSWTAVKFSASLMPDEPFVMWMQMSGGQRILFTITRGDTTIASGSLQHHGPPAGSVRS